jgi:hypothetical protein
MTTPITSPFKLHFLPGHEHGLRDVKSHERRKYGWLPNGRSKSRSKRKKARR